MKQKWEMPDITSYSISDVVQDFNPDYPRKVYCKFCGKTFETGQQYSNHKKPFYNTQGEYLGRQCPSAHCDPCGEVDAGAITSLYS